MHTFVHKVNGGERWFLHFIAKLLRKYLRNHLHVIYNQNIFIIKKRIDFPQKTKQMEKFSADFWRPYFSLLSIFSSNKRGKLQIISSYLKNKLSIMVKPWSNPQYIKNNEDYKLGMTVKRNIKNIKKNKIKKIIIANPIHKEQICYPEISWEIIRLHGFWEYKMLCMYTCNLTNSYS